MLFDDCESHPMSAFMEFDISGDVGIERLQSSLHQVIERHPLYCSTVSEISHRAYWTPCSTKPQLQVVEPGHRLIENEKFDLTREPGLKAFLTPGDPNTLTIMVHHSCSDGLSMVMFVSEWLAVYAGQKLPAPAIEALLQRETWTKTKSAYSLTSRLARLRKIFLGSKPSLLRTSNAEATPSPQPGCCVSKLNVEEFAELRSHIKREGFTINDWLTAALFLTIYVWNQQGSGLADQYRVVIPVNRRAPQEMTATAMNKIGYKILDQKITTESKFEELAEAIRQEMNPTRQNPQGVLVLLKLLKRCKKWKLIPTLLQKQSSFATVVFSNLGDLTRALATYLPIEDGKAIADNLTVEAFRSAPPRRKNTHATVAVSGYAGELFLYSRGDGRGLSYVETQDLLDQFRGRILATIAK